MKRKVIKQGNNTLTITLPKKWTEKFGIKGGDELEIEDTGNSMMISTEKQGTFSRIFLRLLNNNLNTAKNSVVAVYKMGADEIEISFDNEDLVGRDGKKIKTVKFLHQLLHSLVGVSIVEQTKNRCLVRDITGTSSEQFEVILRRVFLLLLSMSEQSLEILSEGSKQRYEEINVIYDNINQFISYCVRSLHKKGNKELQKTLCIYQIINYLEIIADTYRHIVKHFAGEKIDKQVLEIYNGLNKMVRMINNLFYDFKDDRIADFFSLRDKVYQGIYPDLKKDSGCDALLENLELIRLLLTHMFREIVVKNKI